MRKLTIFAFTSAMILVAIVLIATGVRAQNYGPNNGSVGAAMSNGATNISGTTTPLSTTTTPGLPNTGGGGAALAK